MPGSFFLFGPGWYQSPSHEAQAYFGFVHDERRHLLRREHFRPGFQFTGDNINREMLLDLFQCYVQGKSAAHNPCPLMIG